MDETTKVTETVVWSMPQPCGHNVRVQGDHEAHGWRETMTCAICHRSWEWWNHIGDFTCREVTEPRTPTIRTTPGNMASVP